jgi:tetratricopeptide (TPR) repeat protein|eukprot:scaffold1548_cov237-Alexandrium_tamarense.AAC.19
MRFTDVYHSIYECLTAFHQPRSSEDEAKWMEIAGNDLASYRKCVDHRVWTFENKLLLLEAEQHFVIGNYIEAEEKYTASIASAKKHRFFHEDGLVKEFFGRFLQELGRIDEAEEHLANSRVLIREVGVVIGNHREALCHLNLVINKLRYITHN